MRPDIEWVTSPLLWLCDWLFIWVLWHAYNKIFKVAYLPFVGKTDCVHSSSNSWHDLLAIDVDQCGTTLLHDIRSKPQLTHVAFPTGQNHTSNCHIRMGGVGYYKHIQYKCSVSLAFVLQTIKYCTGVALVVINTIDNRSTGYKGPLYSISIFQ